LCLASCSRSSRSDPSALTFLIESSPTNLNPRFATDTQSQRIDGLLFSGLLERDNQMNFHGDVAESWSYDPARAEKVLDAAGFLRKQDGVRLRLTLKCSTEEQARLIGAALQEQWRRVGIELEIRPLELATLFSDVAKGNFQMTYQRWVGANTDPDFFEYAFSSKRFPPDGANRGHYRNALTDQIRVEMNQEKRKALCSEVQKILADDLPYLPLWFNDVVFVHRRSLGALDLPSTGNYSFLATLPTHP
jgi:peptide/nickel transport system substrate-binding protein